MNKMMQDLEPHARQGSAEDLESAKGAFTGSARTLNGPSPPRCRSAAPHSRPKRTVAIRQKRLPQSPQPPAGQIQPAAKEPKKIVVKLFANEVFTVDDGPPRDIYDPANTAFLNAIRRQEVPAELQGKDGSDVTLSLMQVPKDYDPSDFPPCAPVPLTTTEQEHQLPLPTHHTTRQKHQVNST